MLEILLRICKQYDIWNQHFRMILWNKFRKPRIFHANKLQDDTVWEICKNVEDLYKMQSVQQHKYK
jgi:hypothetical protein